MFMVASVLISAAAYATREKQATEYVGFPQKFAL